MSDPRFKEFLEDKVEHYSFASKLMDFCLERSTKPSWEEFIKKSQFPILLESGPFKQCQVIFRDRYARCWIEKERNELMDNAVKLLYSIFGEKAEITPQKDDKAIGVMIRDGESCDNLMNWLSDVDISPGKNESAPRLFKKIDKVHVIKAMQTYEKGLNDALDNMDKAHVLRHDNLAYPPTTILALACEFVDQGRRLETGNFQGISPARRFKVLEDAGFEIFPKSESPTAKELFHLVRSKHILLAIEDFTQGIPNEFGPSTQYDLIHDEKPYPPKAILGIACKHLKGGKLLGPKDFSGGEDSECFKTLRREGFKIEPKNKLQLQEGKLYPVPTIIALLKDLWSTNRPKSDNKYKIIENLNFYLDKHAYFKPYGPAWAASPWNEKTWLKEDGSYLFNDKHQRKFWLYAPGEQARLWSDCWERKEIILLWDEIPDLRIFSTKEEIKKAFFDNDPENKNPTNDVLALWEFSNEMNPGDVIIAKRGRSTYLGYGIVTGDYIFNDQVEEGYHVRKVDWKKHGEWEDPVGAFALKTLTDITNLETSSPDYDTYVDRLIDLIGIELDEQPQALERTKETMINYSLIQELQSACKEAGLQYPEKLLQRFTASMLAKRFLILTGLSGSGKTKLAQAFTEWLGNSTTTTDPFYAGAGIESSQKTYRVAKSDSLAVEFWNDESEENSTKVTLGREMIKEWANCISENNFTKETSPRAIRDVINETSQFSPQLHSFETHLKAAAFAFIESQKNEFSHECTEIIPVGSDWTSNENILGYPDGLNPNTYNSTPILDLLLRAELKADLPHFLILDEMNLSHVERYFADMLSAIESDEAIPLYEGNYDDPNTWRLTSTKKKIPPKVKLPKNLFVIGTVNVDETTYMFSPKVLDRANVIEFRVESEDMENFLNSGSQKPDLSKLAGTGSLYAKQFVPAQFSEISHDNQFSDEINRFFKIFSKHDAEFGFRVANEASRLINFQKLLGSDSFNENFDSVIIQKFLPKLHGSRSQLEELLQELIIATISNENQEWADEHLDYESPTYPLSFIKLCRMYRKLQRDQFVSFAEA